MSVGVGYFMNAGEVVYVAEIGLRMRNFGDLDKLRRVVAKEKGDVYDLKSRCSPRVLPLSTEDKAYITKK